MATRKTAAKADSFDNDSDFDILNFSTTEASNEGAVMLFKDPNTGEVVSHQGRDLFLRLLGPDSGEYMRVFKQLQNRVRRRGENHTPSDAEIEADRVADAKALARLVTDGLMFSGGEWVELNKDNAGDFLYKVAPLRAQATAFVMNQGNYLKGKAQA